MDQNGESSNNAMNSAPSASIQPQVVVLSTDFREELEEAERVLDPQEDLWLSTVDGRYCSYPIPVRVGGMHNLQTFYVHRDVLTKSEWFRKALLGNFKEAKAQAIDLPEEDPAIFHFIIAFLYENRFVPLKTAASALAPAVDKGKAREVPDAADSDSSSSSSSSSSSGSSSSRSRWRRRRQEKHPGQHRFGCRCSRCINPTVTRCWDCGRPTPRVEPPPPLNVRVQSTVREAGVPGINVHVPDAEVLQIPEVRIKDEDLRTWLMSYELSLDVYICANRYLMDNLCTAVMRYCIDMLETAGTDAAVPEVLQLCAKLHAGVPQNDPFLSMVLARVGFLQPLLWKNAPTETSDFLVGNPEVAACILREMALRRALLTGLEGLPPMEGVVLR